MMSTLKCQSKHLWLGLLMALSLCSFGATADAHRIIARDYSPIYLGPVWIQVRAGTRALPTFVHRGSVYVLGRRGLNYSIWIKNRTHQRLEVVASVDGRDVISGARTRSFSRRGYVLNPYRYVNITGYRTSRSSVAAFRFSSIRNSYAARRGSSWWRVGSIHIAVFRERGRVVYRPRPLLQHRHRWRGRSKLSRNRDAVLGKHAKRSGAGVSKRRAPGAAPRHRHWHRRRRIYRPGLGTAYGGRRYAPASFTTFVRASSSPSHQLTIGYNNCAGFRSKGICSRSCRCYRRYWHSHRRRPMVQNPRYAPPPR